VRPSIKGENDVAGRRIKTKKRNKQVCVLIMEQGRGDGTVER
jgi:hypothetical protein